MESLFFNVPTEPQQIPAKYFINHPAAPYSPATKITSPKSESGLSDVWGFFP